MSQSDLNFPYEEYDLLTGVSAPGSVATLYRSKTAIRNPHDVALADIMYAVRPSVVLPKILRRKVRLLRKSLNIKDQDASMIKNESSATLDESQNEIFSKLELSDEGKKYFAHAMAALDSMDRISLCDRVAHYDAKKTHSKSPITSTVSKYEEVNDIDKDDIKGHLPNGYEVSISFRNIDRSRVFTSTELEKKLSRANAALLDIQKQLVRGEEIYYHDTEQHGNMHKGWDVFIDGALNHLGIDQYIDSNEDDISLIQTSSAPTRRLNSDYRWFSSSCYVIENNQFRILPKTKRNFSFPSLASGVFAATSSDSIERTDCSDSKNSEKSKEKFKAEEIVTVPDLMISMAVTSHDDSILQKSEVLLSKPLEKSSSDDSNIDGIIANESPSNSENLSTTTKDTTIEPKAPNSDRVSRKRKKDNDDSLEQYEKGPISEADGNEESERVSRPTRSSKRRK